MPNAIEFLIKEYVDGIKCIYGKQLDAVILYGSYARGDFREDSDIDIMILLDMNEAQIKEYRHQLSDLTYEFNMDHNLDIKPLAKSTIHFYKWVEAYPFYSKVNSEGVKLYEAA